MISTTIPIYTEVQKQEITLAMAEHPGTPSALLVKLSKHPNFTVRKAVAANSNTPPECLIEMASSAEELKIIILTANNNPPLKIIDDWASSLENCKYNSLVFDNLPKEKLLYLCTENDWNEKRSVVKDLLQWNDCSSEILMDLVCKISNNEEYNSELVARFYSIIVEHQKCTEKIVETIWDRFGKIDLHSKTSLNKSCFYKSLAESHLTSPSILVELNKMGVCVAANSNTPLLLLGVLAQNRSSKIRIKVATSCAANEILVDLARDIDPDVRRSVSQNPSASPDVRELAKAKE